MSGCWGFEILKMKGLCVGGPSLCSQPLRAARPHAWHTAGPIHQAHLEAPCPRCMPPGLGMQEVCTLGGPRESAGPGGLVSWPLSRTGQCDRPDKAHLGVGQPPGARRALPGHLSGHGASAPQLRNGLITVPLAASLLQASVHTGDAGVVVPRAGCSENMSLHFLGYFPDIDFDPLCTWAEALAPSGSWAFRVDRPGVLGVQAATLLR